MADMITMFQAARMSGAPLVAVRTADPAAAVAALLPALAALNKDGRENAAAQWDAARGIVALNKAGQAALAGAKPEPIKGEECVGFVEAMLAAQRLPSGMVLFALNVHRQLASMEPAACAQHVQAVANLRDALKRDLRMLVMVGHQFAAPLELEHDVVVLDHALPGPADLDALVRDIYASGKQKAPEDVSTAVEALSGLSAFAAEQVAAMSLTPQGLDHGTLWERKRVTIEQARGLRVWRGGERFADLVGLEAVKTHLLRRLKARTPVGVVVWVDEIDKALANVESDTTGVRMDQLKVLLTEMDNNEWRGLVACGVSGGGKSAIAKAFGNEAGVPTIALDLGDAESKFVGESEGNMRHLVDVVKAVGSGHAYFIATSNAATVMRPELQRRFTDGMWMFDLLTAPERAAGWRAYMRKYELKAQPIPDDTGWTGAEIRNACRFAWDTGCTLVEAAQFIVPMATGRADEIERLRRFAHGRFLDASKPGPYRYEEAPMAASVRAIMVAPAGKGTVN